MIGSERKTQISHAGAFFKDPVSTWTTLPKLAQEKMRDYMEESQQTDRQETNRVTAVVGSQLTSLCLDTGS